jgi:anti-sigma B factor antagonist
LKHSPSPAHAERVRDIIAATPSPSFACRIHADGDTAIVAPCGELDIDTVPILDGDLAAVRDLGFRKLVVDLRGLTFIDSSGIQLFVRWSMAAARDGRAFRLIPGSDRVQLVFRITGLLETLGFESAGRAA